MICNGTLRVSFLALDKVCGLDAIPVTSTLEWSPEARGFMQSSEAFSEPEVGVLDDCLKEYVNSSK